MVLLSSGTVDFVLTAVSSFLVLKLCSCLHHCRRVERTGKFLFDEEKVPGTTSVIQLTIFRDNQKGNNINLEMYTEFRTGVKLSY